MFQLCSKGFQRYFGVPRSFRRNQRHSIVPGVFSGVIEVSGSFQERPKNVPGAFQEVPEGWQRV